jgi:hypothetical protein
MFPNVHQCGIDTHELGLYLAAKISQTAILAITINQRTTKLFFQPLDRARQAGLRYTAAPCGFSEIQRFGKVQEISDLIEVQISFFLYSIAFQGKQLFSLE